MRRPTRRRSRYPTRESSFRKGLGMGCGAMLAYLVFCFVGFAALVLFVKLGGCS